MHRCDPTYVCKDISIICPWMVELRRAVAAELRGALLRVKRHLLPANTSVPEDVLAPEGEVPAEGTSLLRLATKGGGAGSRAEGAPLDSVDRIRRD